MISLDLIENKLVARPYGEGFYTAVSKLKKAGFSFDQDYKAWIAPFSKVAFFNLLGYFRSEVAYRRPYEEFVGQPLVLEKPQVDVVSFKDLLAGHLKYEPFPYQWEGAAFLYSKKRALLADAMGLGKTLQLIMAVKAGLLEGSFKRVLVVCPAHLRRQWQAEFRKFTDLEPIVIDGSRVKRGEIYARLGESFVAIINYELLRGRGEDNFDLKQVLNLKVDCLVCDEIHRAKERSTATAAALRKFKDVPYKFLATGTPFQKQAEDVYSIFEILDKNILGKLSDFRKKYIVFNFNERYMEVVGYKNLGELHKTISEYMIRRNKDEVGLQLPEKLEQTILVDMTDEQIVLHKKLMDRLVNVFYSLQTEKVPENVRKLENEVKMLFTFLQECADAPYLLAISSSRQARSYVDKVSKASPKIDLIEDIVREKVEGGEKVVIFTKYRRFLDMIAARLKEYGPLLLHQEVKNTCRADGSCASCKEECSSRVRIQWLFNNDPKYKVLITTDAGQEGLNLPAGSTLIHADLLWNPAAMDQRSDRIHRVDSEHEKVHIIRLISAGSVEERMLARLAERQAVGKSIIDGIKEIIG